jgi:hypothetical protein
MLLHNLFYDRPCPFGINQQSRGFVRRSPRSVALSRCAEPESIPSPDVGAQRRRLSAAFLNRGPPDRDAPSTRSAKVASTLCALSRMDDSGTPPERASRGRDARVRWSHPSPARDEGRCPSTQNR